MSNAKPTADPMGSMPATAVGFASLCSPYDSTSMQAEHAVDGAQLRGLDQLGMRDSDREQRSLELFLPEAQEIRQRREFRKQVVVLPDIGLQQRRMVRHPIKDLRRRQTVTQHLLPEILG